MEEMTQNAVLQEHIATVINENITEGSKVGQSAQLFTSPAKDFNPFSDTACKILENFQNQCMFPDNSSELNALQIFCCKLTVYLVIFNDYTGLCDIMFAHNSVVLR